MLDSFPYESKFYERFRDYTHRSGEHFLHLELTLDINEVDVVGTFEWIRNRFIVEIGGRTLYLNMMCVEDSRVTFTLEYVNPN